MSNTIADILTTDERFKTLKRLVSNAPGILEILKGKNMVTVFAPLDTAFAKLPAGELEKLMNDEDLLLDILRFHVVPGSLDAAAVKEKASTNTGIAAMDHNDLTFKIDGESLTVSHNSSSANVVETDVKAENGVIHAIDNVLNPMKP